MADRYPNEEYGREGSRGRFSRSQRWGEDEDWRRGSRQGGRFGSQDEDDDERRGYGAYGGGYGQGMGGNYAGGYDRNRREWDEEFGRGGGYGGSYGQGGMRGQAHGGGGYRDRDDYDRAYGLQGSSYSQQGQSQYGGAGQGGYSGQSYGGYGGAQYGQSHRGAQYGQGGAQSGPDRGYGQADTGNWGQGGWSQRGQGGARNWGQGGPPSGRFGQDYSSGLEQRGAQQGYGGYDQNFRHGQEGQFSGYSQGFGQNQGYGQSSFGPSSGFGSEQSGAYLTRGGRQQWGRHGGRGPKNYTRSDDRIREDVNDRLTDDPEIDASEIDVKVANCEVTLMGTVDSREAKRRAEDCAESVSGVKNVQNNLRVQQSSEDEPTRSPLNAGRKNKAGGGDSESSQKMQ